MSGPYESVTPLREYMVTIIYVIPIKILFTSNYGILKLNHCDRMVGVDHVGVFPMILTSIIGSFHRDQHLSGFQLTFSSMISFVFFCFF